MSPHGDIYTVVGVAFAILTFAVIFGALMRLAWTNLHGPYRLWLIPFLPLAVMIAGLGGLLAAPFWPTMLSVAIPAGLGCLGAWELIRRLRRG